MNGKIYRITCLVNGKSYIGQTIRKPSERWYTHINDPQDLNTPLHQDIQKYGVKKFKFEVLVWNVESKELLNKLERDLLSIAPENRYNGKSGRKKKGHWKHSKEICRLYTKDLLSLQKIATLFKTNQMAIRRVLIENNIELRKYSPRKSEITYQLLLDL